MASLGSVMKILVAWRKFLYSWPAVKSSGFQEDLYSIAVNHYFFSRALQPPSGPRAPHYRGLQSHSDTAHSVGLLWTSDQPVVEVSLWQHTTLTETGFEVAIPASEWPRTHVLDRAAIGTSNELLGFPTFYKFYTCSNTNIWNQKRKYPLWCQT